MIGCYNSQALTGQFIAPSLLLLLLCFPPRSSIPESPADRCSQLYIYDELLAVNDQDVSNMDHGDIVALIKASSTHIALTVQQPEDLDKILRQGPVNCHIPNTVIRKFFAVKIFS